MKFKTGEPVIASHLGELASRKRAGETICLLGGLWETEFLAKARMKSPNPSPQRTSASFSWALAVGAGLLASTSDLARARFTYDMRAISVDDPSAAVLDSKHVRMVTDAVVTFEIWVQITSPSGAGVFGYQHSAFSILSSNGGSILGNVGLFNPLAPWNSASSPYCRRSSPSNSASA